MSGESGGADHVRAGLCASCRHARQVPTPRFTYLLCGLAASDPRFDKYPRLPVVSCDGYERGTEEPEPR